MHKRAQRISVAAVLIIAALPHTFAQSAETQTREQAALAEEQTHLRRQLRRLNEHMAALARRFEGRQRGGSGAHGAHRF